MRRQASLAQRLQNARKQHFVGRAAERALFRQIITADPPTTCILHIWGPGGIGKTSLLRAFHRICDEQGATAVFLDGRDIETTPRGFLHALGKALFLNNIARPTVTQLVEKVAENGRFALLIDQFETIAPLDRWLRHSLLPHLPGDTLTVFASRDALTKAWHTDPGWRSLVTSCALRNLNQKESRTYLTGQHVPATHQDAILRFTHGHPLALSLAADMWAQQPNHRFEPARSPNIIRELVAGFVANVPSPAHRVAVEASALVRLMTEPLLAAMLALDDAHELFDWLRQLSFMESTGRGVVPNQLAREALTSDLRWRNPDWYHELRQRARGYYRRHVMGNQVPQGMLIDYMSLHRDNPTVRPFYEQLTGQGSVAAFTPDNLETDLIPELAAMVAEFEGDGAATLATFWLQQQPENVIVYRDAEQQIAGWLLLLALDAATPEAIDRDPATQAAWATLQAKTPLRAGERATYFRFWLTRDGYQAVSPLQSLIFVDMVRHYLTTPNLAFSFLPCAQPNFWQLIFAYADLHPLPTADFSCSGQQYGVFGHDWRKVPPLAWLDLLAQRESATDPVRVERKEVLTPIMVLSQDSFETAVRDALKQFTEPDKLLDSPLLHSRLLSTTLDSDAERVVQLQQALQTTAATFQASSKGLKLYRALYHTYFQPAPSQEKAAEIVDVGYSSFRRHLSQGIERLVTHLWQQEIGETPK